MNAEIRDLKEHCNSLIEELADRIKILEGRIDELESKQEDD
jgi:uncharacterized protein Yka (UPF0111/DUF47 family)